MPRPDWRLRLLETSPRLGPSYRRAMESWFDYLCSDYDERAHAGTRRLDLQAIDLPDASIDVVLTPHVLEHVPSTDAALGELHRVLAPGGRMYLQVPVLQGRTAAPPSPEFHGDSTPVFWRFGFDLTARLRSHGFETAVLATSGFLEAAGERRWDGPVSGEFDVDDMLAAVVPEDLVALADHAASQRHGFEPAYMFLTWECRRA
jgi:SAM-dependent methyltransferase